VFGSCRRLVKHGLTMTFHHDARLVNSKSVASAHADPRPEPADLTSLPNFGLNDETRLIAPPRKVERSAGRGKTIGADQPRLLSGGGGGGGGS
jgi:hypothetical protein